MPNHPDDERLAALSGGDPDATADRALDAHVAGCVRCASLIEELTTLRSALANLPDLRPHRPLQLHLPAPRPALGARLAALWQRSFAPVMGVAAALLLVGVVGTGAGAWDQLSGAASELGAPAEEHAREHAPAAEPDAGEPQPGTVRIAEDDGEAGDLGTRIEEAYDAASDQVSEVAVAGWPWSAVLITGLVLMVLAIALRLALRPGAEER